MLASSRSGGLDTVRIVEQLRGEPWGGAPLAGWWGARASTAAAVDSGPAGRRDRDRRGAPEQAAG